MIFRHVLVFVLVCLAVILFEENGFAQTPPVAASLQNRKVNAGASAHSKATSLTHPTATAIVATLPPAGLNSPPLKWADAVRISRTQNADLHAAQALVDQNDANIKSAWGGYLPNLSLNASLQKSNTADQADADSDSARLNLTQNIFNGFGDQARIDQAKRQKEAAIAAYDLTSAQVSAQLKTAFQTLLISERNVKLSDDIISRRETNLSIVTLRFEGGRENKGSVLLSQANLDQAKLERLQAANSVESAQVTLAKVLGAERLLYSTVSGSVPVHVPPVIVDFESLAASAPELRQAIATEQSAREGVRVARSGFMPSLDLSASAGRFGTAFFPATDQGLVSLGLTIPLFSGGKTVYGVRAAEAVATNAAFTRESTLYTKIIGIHNAYNAYVEAVEVERVAQSFVTAAEVRAAIARSQYNTGLILFQDWDLIESDLIARQRNSLSSQNSRVSAEAAWEQSLGQGLF